jgi:hypothetical protein
MPMKHRELDDGTDKYVEPVNEAAAQSGVSVECEKRKFHDLAVISLLVVPSGGIAILVSDDPGGRCSCQREINDRLLAIRATPMAIVGPKRSPDQRNIYPRQLMQTKRT